MKLSPILLCCLSTASAFTVGSNNALSIRNTVGRNISTSATAMHMVASSNKNPVQSFFDGIFPKKDVAVEPEKPKIPNVVVDSDYTLTYLFAAIGIFVILTSPDKSCVDGSLICPPSIWGVVQGGLNLLFASFLAIQAKRIRFVFDETSFELKNVDLSATDDSILKDSGENFVVGGANRWTYDSFVNYDFFPKAFPILVYFKETQTPEDSWNEGPGSMDKVGGGQIHFFPAIANTKQLKEQFELRGCAKVSVKEIIE